MNFFRRLVWSYRMSRATIAEMKRTGSVTLPPLTVFDRSRSGRKNRAKVVQNYLRVNALYPQYTEYTESPNAAFER